LKLSPPVSFAWLLVKALVFLALSMETVDIIVIAYQRF
jgi:hypothetical protein